MSRTRIGIVVTLILLISSSFNARAQQPAPSSIASPGTSNAAPKSKPSPSTNQQSAKASQKLKASPAPSPSVPQANLPDMSITATRISQPLSQLGMTVTIVDKQQIQDQKIQQTSDALREVPGVVSRKAAARERKPTSAFEAQAPRKCSRCSTASRSTPAV